jgi:hypothetical protein
MIELSGSFDASNQAGYIARLNDINLDWAAGPLTAWPHLPMQQKLSTHLIVQG